MSRAHDLTIKDSSLKSLLVYIKTIFYVLKLAALLDGDRQSWLIIRLYRYILYLPEDQHRLLVQQLAKHDVLSVQPVRLGTGDKELAAIRVRAAVGHTEETSCSVPQSKAFIRKGIAINTHPSSTIRV